MALASNTIHGVPNSVGKCGVGGENSIVHDSVLLPRPTDGRLTAPTHRHADSDASVETVGDGVDVLEATAVAAWEAANLVPMEMPSVNHATIVAGNIVSHHPVAAAELYAGSVVKYAVSLGA